MSRKYALRTLDDLDFAGKRVLLRLDLNVPIKSGKIVDDSRIRAALPTIEAILKKTNKIAIMSHLGRPDGDADPKYSLEPVGQALSELLDYEIVFIEDYLEAPLDQVLAQLDKNQLILLENIRFHKGETANDTEFATTIARHFDCYVDDAFGALHRAHASVVRMAEIFPKTKRAAGYLIQKEVAELGRLLTDAKGPFTVIMGGAKVSDKIKVILSLLTKCNHLIIGGAMSYTFLKYLGKDVGASRVEHDKMDLIASIYKVAEERRVQIHLPIDHIGAKEFQEDSPPIRIDTDSIPSGIMGLDIGPQSLEAFSDVIKNSNTVLWNGPMGVFEWPAFSHGSRGIAQAMADCTARTIVGGGDSVACVNLAGLSDKMDHVSTGGGASLEFLEGKVLPGIRVLLED